MRRPERAATTAGGTGPAPGGRQDTDSIGIAGLVAMASLVTLLVPAALIGTARPASAHSRLVTTSPAAGSTLDPAPGEVTLTFDEAVSPRYSDIAVTDAKGARVTAGTTRVEGATVHQGLAALGAGRYTVAYRVVSADGHPVGGTFTFTVTGTPTTAAAGTVAAGTPRPAAAATNLPGGTGTTAAAPTTGVPAAAPTTAPAPEAGHTDDGGGGGGWIIAAAIVAVVVLGAAGLFALRRRHLGAR